MTPEQVLEIYEWARKESMKKVLELHYATFLASVMTLCVEYAENEEYRVRPVSKEYAMQWQSILDKMKEEG